MLFVCVCVRSCVVSLCVTLSITWWLLLCWFRCCAAVCLYCRARALRVFVLSFPDCLRLDVVRCCVSVLFAPVPSLRVLCSPVRMVCKCVHVDHTPSVCPSLYIPCAPFVPGLQSVVHGLVHVRVHPGSRPNAAETGRHFRAPAPA